MYCCGNVGSINILQNVRENIIKTDVAPIVNNADDKRITVYFTNTHSTQAITDNRRYCCKVEKYSVK